MTATKHKLVSTVMTNHSYLLLSCGHWNMRVCTEDSFSRTAHWKISSSPLSYSYNYSQTLNSLSDNIVLTLRVTVNIIWQYIGGMSIVNPSQTVVKLAGVLETSPHPLFWTQIYFWSLSFSSLTSFLLSQHKN